MWTPPSGRPALAAALSAAAEAAWATDTLAGLAESGTTLADGTEVFVGRIAFAADGPAFTLPGPPPARRTRAIPPTLHRSSLGTATCSAARPRACGQTVARSSSCVSRPAHIPCLGRGR
jgi:hypothetical protein